MTYDEMPKKLRVTIPSHSQADGFKIMSGDEDITNKLAVRKASVSLEAGKVTTVVLECYAQQVDVEALPENVNINVVEKEKN